MEEFDLFWILKELKILKWKKEILAREHTVVQGDRLISIDLSDLGITAIPPGTFTGYEYLEYINLSHNRIGSIPRGEFRSLINLKHLDISYNNLSPPPKDLFERTKGLEYLDLSNNNITHISGEVFQELQELKTLLLNNNSISTLPRRLFSRTTELRVLELRGCAITSLDGAVFDKLQQLTALDLGENRLSELPESIFEPLHSLEVLKVNNNRLSRLPNLQKCRKLKQIWLQGNKIQTAGITGKLNTLTDITHLLLNGNDLQEVPEDITRGIPSLQFLLLNGNRLTHIPENTVLNNPALSELWIQDNPTAEAGVYRGKEQLLKLTAKLQENSAIRDLLTDILGQLGVEKQLTNVLDREHTVFENQDLVELDLSNLKLSELPQQFLHGHKELRRLDLSNNSLTTVKQQVFTHLKKLQYLDLSYNKISSIDTDAFPRDNLKFLDLSKNPLPLKWGRRFDDEFDLTDFLDYIDDNIRVLNKVKEITTTLHISEDITSRPETTIERGKLLSLDLSNVQIPSLELQILHDFTNLQRIILRGCGIQKINSNGAPPIKLLDLRDNNITTLEPVETLNTLLLSNNKISRLPELETMPQLQTLVADHNPIRQLPVFRGTELQEIDLSNCLIEEIPIETFQHLKELRRLDLSSNKIQNISVKALMKCKTLRYLNLQENPGYQKTILEGKEKIQEFLKDLLLDD